MFTLPFFSAIAWLLPWALLLVLPAFFAWYRWLRSGSGSLSRLLALLLLVSAAAGPRWEHGRGGSDVVVLLDRSASMDEARTQHGDLLRLIGDQRGPHDRLAVVVVGAEVAVASPPRSAGLPEAAVLAVPDDGSDLAAGLRTARALIGHGRSGRVVLVSDGEDTGVGLRAAAAACAAAHIPVDVLPEIRPGATDAAILEVELPGELRHGESFTGAARLICDTAGQRGWRVLRGGVVVGEGRATLLPYQPVTITFSDRPPQARLTEYVIELDATDDRRPANNRAIGVLRVSGGERVLIIGGDGTPGNIARALTAAGMRVQTRAEGPVTLADLSGAAALILEQVPADRLGHAGMEAIAQWVEHLGGGLVVTGGRRGFGVGGYHRSPIERVSPVTMEIRDEQRKLSVAMAISLDRSGSMSVGVGGGKTKMDLADEGACAAIELLGPLDQVAVLAVDSASHSIVGLTKLGMQRSGILRQVRGIRSEGGGIYMYEALLGAGKELATASAGTKHVVVFADANDAEQPGDYVRLLKEFTAAGITVSVVAMGTAKDSDAALLEDIAKRGGGRITYASDPADIPRLFAQETVLVSRTAWVDQALQPQRKPGLELLMPGFRPEFPQLPGYNLTYVRERAQLLAWCAGDPAAPAAAAWRIGTGRTIALPFNCDDPKAPAVTAWAGYATFMSGVVRWVAGDAGQAPGAISVVRTGRTAVFRLELDPRMAAAATVAPALTLVDAGGADARRTAWQQVDTAAWEARCELADRAVVPAAAVAMGDEVRPVVGPAVRLPMSPEVEPRFGREPGAAVLAAVAREAGGAVRTDVVGVFKNPPSLGTGLDLAWLLVVAALIVLLVEITLRRWRLAWGLPSRSWLPNRNWLSGSSWWNWSSQPTSQPTSQLGTPVVGPTPSLSVRPASPQTPSEISPPRSPPASAGGLHDALAELRRRRGR